ncbi:MAG: NAD(+) diphosphatase [Azonexaceae bacterium]|nr:NAD(+) diphosphatase [Azonexaceae bacterium]
MSFPLSDESPCWFVRAGNRLLMSLDAGGNLVLPSDGRWAVGEAVRDVGNWQGRPCHAVDVPETGIFPGLQPFSLREVFQLAGRDLFQLAGRAAQLLDWRRQHRYCGQCGLPTERKDGEFAMHCPGCGLHVYPRISPAVMVLVRHGARLLLARSPRFKPGVHSALAGFVEPGETLEQCAEREVREEVGVAIANLRYFDSQPWPFPNSLMIAFFADYAGGELRPDGVEIESAGWFLPGQLPLLPDPISISRRLIDAALSA